METTFQTETMGELLERLQEFVRQDFRRDVAERTLGWHVEDITVRTPSEDETLVSILLEKSLAIDVRYFLNVGLHDTGEDCEFRLKLRSSISSRVGYNIFYSGYIHGQGYIRISLGDVENKMVQKVLDEFYVPRLKDIYKPIIIEFKGFYSRDFFGVAADSTGSEIYYSPVRARSEEAQAPVLDVIARLYHLDSLLRSEEILHRLAELDLQMSFLPSVMWL